MLEAFVSTEKSRRRYLSTPIGTHIDGYLDYLKTLGFARRHIYDHAQHAAAFGEYLAKNGAALSSLTEEHVDGFVSWYQSHPRRFGKQRQQSGSCKSVGEACRGCARRVLAYLRSIGVTPMVPDAAPHPHLRAYCDFLDCHRGFAARTVELHAHCVGQLLDAIGEVAMDRLTVTDVEHAVVELSKGIGVRSHQIMISAIESFLRFERTTGRIPMSCKPFLPRRRQYALAQLPSALSEVEVAQVLAVIDQSSAMGRRDYAILQLLATYGLRPSEIMQLRLDDIDWRAELLHVKQQKVRRELTLPLLAPVASALIAYLSDGRPETDDRRIFRKVHAPDGPLTRGLIYSLVRKAIVAAGIHSKHRGPRTFRHARATSLLRQGTSLKAIGDLLGHRDPEATAIYCKLAVDDLRRVALEIPGAERSP